MSASDGLAAYFGRSRRNAVLTWLLVVVLGVTIVAGAFLDRREPVLFSVVTIAVVAAPVIKFRDPVVVPPWYFVGLVCLPVLWEAFTSAPPATGFVPSLAVATLGLLMAVELDRFTPLRLVPWFAVVLTVLLTLAMSGLLNVLRWSSDVVLGTTYLLDGRSQDAVNAAVMIEFVYATVAGVVAGAVFYLYFKRVGRGGATPDGPSSSTRTSSAMGEGDGSVPSQTLGEPDPVGEADTVEDSAVEDATGVLLSDRLGIATRRQVQLVRFMQVVLAGLFVYGLWSRQIAVVTNAALGLGITFLPAVLKRDYEVAIEPGLVLWVTLAVFLHALGTAGLYDAISTWDHLTHTLSATVVAATGYAALRAIHLHSDRIHLPRWALFSCLLVFMLAMSVIWEILEFVVDQGALRLDMEPILAQHGIDDTIVDMIFNLIGSVIVATWGTVYLTEVSESLARTLEARLGTVE